MTDTSESPAPRKPRDEELDVWGLTHQGNVRETNEGHFLLGSLRKRLDIKATSLPEAEQLRACNERVSVIAMIADGVGGQLAGEEASRVALEEATQYVTQLCAITSPTHRLKSLLTYCSMRPCGVTNESSRARGRTVTCAAWRRR